MNYWKWIVIGLLSLVALFHIGVVAYIWNKNYDLTSVDYYEREIRHQETIEKMRAGRAYQWRQRVIEDGLRLEMTLIDANGKPVYPETLSVHFYRPSDAARDQKFQLSGNGSGPFQIPLPQPARGFWRMTFETRLDGRDIAHRAKVSL